MSLKAWSDIGILQREIEPYNHLAGHFKKIYIFSYGKDDYMPGQLAKNIEVVQKKSFLPSSIYSFMVPLFQRREIKECDILKTNQMQGAISAVISKLLFNKKIVVRSGYIASLMAKQHGLNILRRLAINIEEYAAYRLADRIIIPAEINMKYVSHNYPFTKNKIFVINNMVSTSIFRPMKIKKEKKLIGYVGRLDKRQKNLYSLISSVRGLGVRLIFVGEGPEKERLKAFAKINDVPLDIKGIMKNHQLPAFLNSLDIFVLPSRYEGNPKALLEAMSCGCAVIGCDVYGVNNITMHGCNGLLSEPDPDSLRKMIKSLIGNPSLRKRIGSNARKTILSNYDFDDLIKKEIAIYSKL